MNKVYAVFGENGLGTTKNWDKTQRLKKYLGRGITLGSVVHLMKLWHMPASIIMH